MTHKTPWLSTPRVTVRERDREKNIERTGYPAKGPKLAIYTYNTIFVWTNRNQNEMQRNQLREYIAQLATSNGQINILFVIAVVFFCCGTFLRDTKAMQNNQKHSFPPKGLHDIWSNWLKECVVRNKKIEKKTPFIFITQNENISV